jgi:FAD/FMN-containing dehydrogenase
MADSNSPSLAGWGGIRSPGIEIRSEDLVGLSESTSLSRGMGRSYGDSSLPVAGAAPAANTTLGDRLLAFDPQTRILRVEAGFTLFELRRLLLERGFFTPVTPGTQFVTLGGMVASDVHGKNHHISQTFGEHVQALLMRVADGRIVECSREQHPDLFWATIGGMGLTGHILEVAVRLESVPSPWIYQDFEVIPNIDAFLEALSSAADVWPFTVGWLDCLKTGSAMGRGILFKGRWATAAEAPSSPPKTARGPTVPFRFPSWALNRVSVSLFNEGFYRKHGYGKHNELVSSSSFFYPLDSIRRWNRIYGKAGFTQHQCVIPKSAGPQVVRRYMELLTSLGGASFLCVIKDCGPQGHGTLSFPMPGTSIALDLPVRTGIQEVINTLNRFLIDVGGRVYLAKDNFTRAEDFRAMEPRLERFTEVRKKWDPGLRFRSAQSVRLLGDPSG